MLKSQMKDMPEAEQEKLITIVSQNPELFQKIALEVQAKMKNGGDQMTVMLEVLGKHKDELQKIIPPDKK